MKGYVFIANSTKPSAEACASRAPVKVTNVSRPCLQMALDMGYEVYLGTNRDDPEELECELPVKKFDSHTYRSLTAFSDNRTAYKNLCRVMKTGNIKAIHCNTPIGGMVGRLCAKKYRVDKVIYTAHGFHFYKGAPLLNRTVLKWAEKIMARWTDAIITMNQEDYEAAKKFKLRKGGKVYFVHGVGITLKDFEGLAHMRQQKREEMGVTDEDIVLISMGDLVPRKNYGAAIRAVAKANDARLHYMICGKGPELEKLQQLAKELGVEQQIHFLGFRTDVKELLTGADIFLFTTRQEGLPRSMMEAMASGLPCVASRIRGNVDLIEDGVNGYTCATDDVDGYAAAIATLVSDPALREQIKQNNLEKIKQYDVSVVEQEIRAIYAEVLPEKDEA